MSITYDHHLWLWSYYSWLCSSLMDITYEHQVLCLMTHHLWVSHKTVTHDHHPWLWTSQMTMSITWLTTTDHDYHPWLWISLTTYHHSWLAHITHGRSHHPWLVHIIRDYHLCVSPMTVTDALSLVLITSHPWHSSLMTITNDHDYHSLLMTMTSYSWLTPMSYHPCLLSYVLSLMSMTYDLWLITCEYHIRPSMTMTHDHQVWSLDFSPMTSHSWLLRSSHQWPWLP